MKIVLNYEKTTSQITDNNGAPIFTWGGLEDHELVENSFDVDNLIKLKNAGFTTDEIIELRRKELI